MKKKPLTPCSHDFVRKGNKQTPSSEFIFILVVDATACHHTVLPAITAAARLGLFAVLLFTLEALLIACFALKSVRVLIGFGSFGRGSVRVPTTVLIATFHTTGLGMVASGGGRGSIAARALAITLTLTITIALSWSVSVAL